MAEKLKLPHPSSNLVLAMQAQTAQLAWIAYLLHEGGYGEATLQQLSNDEKSHVADSISSYVLTAAKSINDLIADFGPEVSATLGIKKIEIKAALGS
jgi:hypothetical protein